MQMRGSAASLMPLTCSFLPSFLFILIGAPAVEATRHEIGFTAPLPAITAAVVGVVINLAVFLA
jgi:chromate transporter